MPRNVHSGQSTGFARAAGKIAAASRELAKHSFLYRSAQSLAATGSGELEISVAQTNDSFVLTANLGHKITDAIFFPLAESQVSNAAPQTLVPTATGFTLTLRKSDQLLKPIARLKGVLMLSGEQAYSIDVPIGKPVATGPIGSK